MNSAERDAQYIASTIRALARRVGELERAPSLPAPGWQPIGSGSTGGLVADFTVPVPTGYSSLRLRLSGRLSATADIAMRVNGDSGGNYQRAFTVWNADGTVNTSGSGAATGRWTIGRWGTTSNFGGGEILVIDGARKQMRANLWYSGGSRSEGWGVHDGAVVSSITIVPEGGPDIDATWTLEGYRS